MALRKIKCGYYAYFRDEQGKQRTVSLHTRDLATAKKRHAEFMARIPAVKSQLKAEYDRDNLSITNGTKMNIIQQVEKVLSDERDSGMTQEEIAAKHNVRQSQIQRLLTRQRTVAYLSLRTFVKMFPKATVCVTGDAPPAVANRVATAMAAAEDFRLKAMDAIIDLDLPPDAMQVVLRTLKNIK